MPSQLLASASRSLHDHCDHRMAQNGTAWHSMAQLSEGEKRGNKRRTCFAAFSRRAAHNVRQSNSALDCGAAQIVAVDSFT